MNSGERSNGARSTSVSAHTPSDPHRGRLRRIALYGVFRTATEALLATRGLLLAFFLAPEAFGIWTLFRLALRYGESASLGVPRALELELARSTVAPAAARPDPQHAASAATAWGSSALGFTVLTFGGLAALLFAASFAVADGGIVFLLRAIAIALLLERLWNCGLAYLRPVAGLRSLSMVEGIHAALQVVITTGLAWRWGLSGALIGFVVSTGLGLLLLRPRVPRQIVFRREPMAALVRRGSPVGFALFLSIGAVTIDRVIVAGAGGIEMLGYYGLAVALSGVGAVIGWVIRTVIFPDVYRSTELMGTRAALQDHLDNAVLPVARLFPPLLGILALAIGPLVAGVLPGYLDALPAARVFLFTGATVALANLGTLGILAAERQRILPRLSALALVTNAGLTVAALLGGLGLWGVAVASLLARSIRSGGMFLVIVGVIEHPSGRVRYLVHLLFPLAWCASAVLGLTHRLPGTDIASAIRALGIYSILLAPLLPGIVAEIRRMRARAEI